MWGRNEVLKTLLNPVEKFTIEIQNKRKDIPRYVMAKQGIEWVKGNPELEMYNRPKNGGSFKHYSI